MGDVVDMHYPITEMSCASKISCIAWNPYHKSELASSDYDGAVTLWDPFTTKKTHVFQVACTPLLVDQPTSSFLWWLPNIAVCICRSMTSGAGVLISTK